MKVIICEDNLEQRRFIQNEIVKYSSFHLPGVEITLCASRSDEVLHYIEYFSADCYLLDINLNGNIDGLQLAAQIRKRDPLGAIIFITSFADKLKLTFKYKIAALDYIEKNQNKDKFINAIIESLSVAYNRYYEMGNKEDSNIFQVKVGEILKNIKFNDIYFFETSQKSHKVKVHTTNGIYEFYGKLKDLETLDTRFFRCHHSYLINIDYISEYNLKKGIVRMKNNHDCLVSYRNSKKLKQVINT